MNDTKALEREQLIKDLGTIYYGSTIAKRAADVIEAQAAQLDKAETVISFSLAAIESLKRDLSAAREKHYEECAAICEQVASKCQDSTTPEYSQTHHHQWCEGDVCAGKIRVAAKEPK